MYDIQKIEIKRLSENIFRLIDEDWFLLSAGNLLKFNTMTAAWAGFGMLWKKPVAFCFVRPTRYTYEFMEQNELFSMCFLKPGWRKALNYCGTRSGREVDKIKETGLNAFLSPAQTIFFEEGKLMLECRKLHFEDLNPSHFLEPEIDKNYPLKDYHRLYIAEILSCYVQSHDQE